MQRLIDFLKTDWLGTNNLALAFTMLAPILSAGLIVVPRLIDGTPLVDWKGGTFIIGIIYWTCITTAALFYMEIILQRRKFNRIERRQEWLIDSVNKNIDSLRKRANEQGGSSKSAQEPVGWPWGSHHTENLGHLDAAARKWWNLYDPADPTTAPTNEMVSEWLRADRGVSKEKSQAIASILRADGLRTGPR